MNRFFVPLLLVCLLATQGCQKIDSGKGKDSKQTKPAVKKSKNSKTAFEEFLVRFDGKKIPAGWKRTQYGGEGSIDTEVGVIRMEIGQALTGLHWETKDFPKNNFEFRVRARRIVGEDMTCGLTFPVGDQFASLIVGGWGGSVVGISCINGKPADENETTKNLQLKHNQWYTVRVQFHSERLICFVDDEKVVDLATKGRKFSLRGDCESSQPFSVFTFGTCIEVDRLEIVRLGPRK